MQKSHWHQPALYVSYKKVCEDFVHFHPLLKKSIFWSNFVAPIFCKGKRSDKIFIIFVIYWYLNDI